MNDERIVADPKILVGKPVVRGTRLSVDFLLGLLADGWDEAVADALAGQREIPLDAVEALRLAGHDVM
jgi:uncharacterized protein (DUF433 family)